MKKIAATTLLVTLLSIGSSFTAFASESVDTSCPTTTDDRFVSSYVYDISVLQATKEAFEADPVMATVNTMFSVIEPGDNQEIYEAVKRENLQVYWQIIESDSDFFTVEVAIYK